MMKEESDSFKQIELFKSKIMEKGYIHQSLLEYLDISGGEINKLTNKTGKSKDFYKFLKKENVLTTKCEFREFLGTISHLWEIHQSKQEIKKKIENLIIIIQKNIKLIFPEIEIFGIFYFCNNSNILLILVEQKILSVETIINNINLMDKINYEIVKYFYPEIRKCNELFFKELIEKNDKLKIFVQKNDQDQKNFLKIRKEGGKEPNVVEMIRDDKIKEFISFVELTSIDLKKKIHKNEAIFENNDKDLTPIEYSALFGSINIFKYLFLKEANIDIFNKYEKNNIIGYAIQGRNYEIIHLLEERKEIKEELNNQNKQLKYLKVSISMYYNEIFEYFITNYNNQITIKVIKSVIEYRNYQLFDQLIKRNQIDFKNRGIISNIFYYICENRNDEIVKILMKHQNFDINSRDKIYQHLFGMNNNHKKTTESRREYSLLLIEMEMGNEILI